MKVGTWVRLKQRVREGPQKARIEVEDDAFTKGAVKLSAPLAGIRWWNKADLVATSAPRSEEENKC